MSTKLRDCLLVVGGFAILVALVVVTDPPHATAGPGAAPVTVVNTGANPVPTAGTITNAPNVHAVQSGTWNVGVSGNVGITGTPNVNVANMPSVSFGNTSATPLFVRDVDNGARHPLTTNCGQVSSTLNSVSCSMPPVPAGEEVVIETESFQASGDPSNTQLVTSVAAVAGGATQTAFGTVQDNGLDQPGLSYFESTSAVKLYADPGTSITCLVQTKGSNPGPNLSLDFCVVSGYFVTLP